jgi:hypothetical protein
MHKAVQYRRFDPNATLGYDAPEQPVLTEVQGDTPKPVCHFPLRHR